MTNAEAIEQLKHMKLFIGYDAENPMVKEMQSALDLAIKALEQTELNPSYNSIKTELEPCEDCISRAEALHACCDEWNKDYKAIMKSIRQLPSVTPQPSEDWYDVPSDEMTLEQARQAVKNLRKKLAEHLEQQPNRCDSCIHSEEQDGSNCYECIKGMADNFEAQPADAGCISREAVIKHICESKECYKDECKGRLYKRCFDLQWIYALPSVTPQQTRWIPVSERLPQDGQKVLVTTRSGKIIDVDTSIFYHASAYWEHYVIAWLPLPEPYTESGGNDMSDLFYVKKNPKLIDADVLDKIRAEIEKRKLNSGGEPNRELAFNVCLKIIDKYKAESEDKI